ncbi:GNAT family N-acetyltransferase [uncultured Jatrophihabitans sp.]|uniref:GNAT family N-acetyltransferase n=1 Tax=uncultured Jatrophihabitans sp. TaxID=1610747 RepID=UPI0035CC5F35
MHVEIVDQARTRELRRAVLRPQLSAADALPGDELTDGVHGVHFGAVDDDGTVACTCFVYPDPCPWLPGRTAWHLRQMATLPERRGEGLGRAVVEAAVEQVHDAKAQVLWCNARETARGFYADVGFAEYGDVFTDERHPIPHVRMWRELSRPPTSSHLSGRSPGA